MLIRPHDLILFQGDSITDAGRNRERLDPNAAPAMGGGYVHLVASMLHERYPAMNLRFLNRGVSGNVIGQLLDRWQEDCLDLNPDVLSVLIGINDTAHPLLDPAQGDTVENFELKYRRCLDAARQRNPDLRLVICEPFALICDRVTEAWRPGLEARQAIARRIAEDYGAVFVAFQALFDAMTRDAPPQYWLPDGVHPSPGAHLRMARLWVEAITQESEKQKTQELKTAGPRPL